MSKLENKRAKDLPISVAAWKILKSCDTIMMQLDKDHKHTFGRELISRSFQLLSFITKANRAKTLAIRYDVINEMIDNYFIIANTIKYLAEGKRVVKGGNVISFLSEEHYVEIIPLLANFERQAIGWLNKTQADLEESCQRTDNTVESIQ